MKAPYKVLYLYLLCECDHAGVWICEMDVAALRLGMKLGGRDEVLAELAGAVIDLGGGAWYVVDYVRSQYGTLNPANRVHASVMDRLQGLGMDPLNLPENKPLTSPLQGDKDKDKDKDKDNSEKKGREVKEHDATFEAKKEPAPITWPSWAGPKTLAAWEDFKNYRLAEHKVRYKSLRTEQLAVNALVRYFPSGPALVAALEHSQARSWRFPVDPAEHKYPAPPAAEGASSESSGLKFYRV